MKIYFFNRETGVYLGDDFVNEAPMNRGVFVVPRGATTIAPPQGRLGHIVAFNVVTKRWEFRSQRDTVNQRENQPSQNVRKKSGSRRCDL